MRTVEEITQELSLLKEAAARRERELAEARLREDQERRRNEMTLDKFAELHGESVRDPKEPAVLIFADGSRWWNFGQFERWAVPTDDAAGREVRAEQVRRFHRLRMEQAAAAFERVRAELVKRGDMPRGMWPEGLAGPLPPTPEQALLRLKEVYQERKAAFERADAEFAACPGEAQRRAMRQALEQQRASEKRFKDWCLQTYGSVRLDD